jgi:VanZ family protein
MIAILRRSRYFKILFYIALVVVFCLAIVPDDHVHIAWKYADKIKHASAFFVLSFLLNRASSTIQHRLRNMGALLLFGIFIEFVQYFFPERESSFSDILADLVGILLFQLLYSLLRFIEHQRKKSK